VFKRSWPRMIRYYTTSLSKDNEAARRRLGQAYFTYVEEADDPACAGQALPTKLVKESKWY